MKKIALLLLLFSFGKVFAQRPPVYNNNDRPYNSKSTNTYNSKPINDDDYSQIRIIDTSQEIRADVLPYKSDPKIKNDRYYYWYLNNSIHSTQGGFNGQLLNGHYIAFYPDKNLKEEGNFKKGLKDGEWKTWNPKGDLTGVTAWDDGILVPDTQQPFWKKLPFIKKKDDQQQNSQPGGNQ